jgi:hypothetical protein
MVRIGNVAIEIGYATTANGVMRLTRFKVDNHWRSISESFQFLAAPCVATAALERCCGTVLQISKFFCTVT